MQTNLTASFDDRTIQQMKENHPLKKILTVEEVAETVFSLANDVSKNGVNIVIGAGTNPE
jgi:hypothetical protein